MNLLTICPADDLEKPGHDFLKHVAFCQLDHNKQSGICGIFSTLKRQISLRPISPKLPTPKLRNITDTVTNLLKYYEQLVQKGSDPFLDPSILPVFHEKLISGSIFQT